MTLFDSELQRVLGRRGFLNSVFHGLTGIGLTSLLGRESLAAGKSGWEPGRGQTHFAPKAKRVLQIFCPGAASHVDLWDYKPELVKRDVPRRRAAVQRATPASRRRQPAQPAAAAAA
jgi:hypothetical protein